MSRVFTMYPVLSSKLIEEAEISIDGPEFMYSAGYEVYPLNIKDISGSSDEISCTIEDPRCEWYPEKYNLIFSSQIKIKNPNILFGPTGVAAKTANLGLAIRWMSVKSEHRGIIPFGEISYDNKDILLTANYKFEKNVLKGSLVLETILYLKNSGVPDKDEAHLATNTGTVFGKLNSTEVFVDGNGSVFPIATVNDPSRPLWWVYYDSLDPLHDPFDEEYVEIRLNQAHPAYEALKIESSLKESPLFLEVISAALFIIVESVRETLGPDWDSMLSGQQFDRGSIAEAVYHFVIKLGWDVSSPSGLSQSIHNFFDSNLKGGTL